MEAKSVVKSGFYKGVSLFFEYDTPKIVHIKSKKVGFINRLIQLIILGYVIGYAIVYQKGYQDTDQVVSAASTKVKGLTYTNLSELQRPGISDRIWDPADYVIPPQENNAFFVMTNAVVTLKQSQGVCTEDKSHTNANCSSSADCPPNTYVQNGNGLRTGVCDTKVKMCEIRAWCPVEKDDDFPIKGEPLLDNTFTFTVLIKNQIEFPKFNVKRRNILDSVNNKSYLANCRYNASHEIDQFCPIFELGYIVNNTKGGGEDYTELALSGGFILININWDCNLDRSVENCVPKYSFRRLDDKNSQIAKGWNFRYANYYYVNDTEYRDLIKAYGIRFIIEVTGEAGKFSMVPLLMNFGSGLALLAVATVLCDIVTMYILKKGDFYKEKKYLFVEGDDAFQNSYEEIEGSHNSSQLYEDYKRGLQDGEAKPTDRLSDVAAGQNSYQSCDNNTPTASNQINTPAAQTSDTNGQVVLDDITPCDVTFEVEDENQSVKHRKQKPGEYNRLDEDN